MTGIPGYGDILRDAGHNAMAQYQRLIGPRAVNDLLLRFNRALRSLLQANVATNVASQWDVNWLPSKPIDQGYPSFTVAGFSQIGDIAALLLVMLGFYQQALASSGSTLQRELEALKSKGIKVEKYRATAEKRAGEGERLGTA